jgi:Flp pilus assembly protein TadG
VQRLSLRRRLRGERGASAVLVAVLVVPLLGFGALAVDVAAVYSEKQQLQNGADAAALAIAHDCADGACTESPDIVADDLTDANHEEVGSVRGAPVVDVDTAAAEVTVANPGTQDHWLAPVIGVDSTDVTATATVRWGGPSGGTAVLPLAFSWCEFAKQTGGGLPSGTTARTIYFTKSSPSVAGTPDCTGPSDNIVPGGFAWLDTDPGICGATTEADGTVYSSTGNSVPSPCTSTYIADLVGRTVLLPIFEESGGTGAHAWYRIYGYAAFRITGYSFAGLYKTTPPPCSGSERCIRGYFTRYVDSTGDFSYDPDAPDLGGRVVQLVA